MKKGLIAILSATLGVVSLGGCATTVTLVNNTSQKLDVPSYTLKTAKKDQIKGDYDPQACNILIKGNRTYFICQPLIGDWNGDGNYDWTATRYIIDRNTDGKTDLISALVKPNLKMRMRGGRNLGMLFVDDDFDGTVDRMLYDDENSEGDLGADGIFDWQNTPEEPEERSIERLIHKK